MVTVLAEGRNTDRLLRACTKRTPNWLARSADSDHGPPCTQLRHQHDIRCVPVLRHRYPRLEYDDGYLPARRTGPTDPSVYLYDCVLCIAMTPTYAGCRKRLVEPKACKCFYIYTLGKTLRGEWWACDIIVKLWRAQVLIGLNLLALGGSEEKKTED